MPNVPVEARIDAQELVEILLYLESTSTIVETKSQLVRSCISLLHAILLSKGKMERVTEEEAVRILRDRFKLSERGTRSINRALQSLHIEDDDLDILGAGPSPKTKGMLNDAMDALRRFKDSE